MEEAAAAAPRAAPGGTARAAPDRGQPGGGARAQRLAAGGAGRGAAGGAGAGEAAEAEPARSSNDVRKELRDYLDGVRGRLDKGPQSRQPGRSS